MKTNKEVVVSMYDAFAKGDVPGILGAVSDDFTWTDPADPSIAPQGGTYSGKAGLGAFFQNLVSSIDTTLWEVDGYVSDGNKVVATGKHGVKVKSTGKSGINEWIMIWEIEHGIATKGRNYFDTARYQALFQ